MTFGAIDIGNYAKTLDPERIGMLTKIFFNIQGTIPGSMAGNTILAACAARAKNKSSAGNFIVLIWLSGIFAVVINSICWIRQDELLYFVPSNIKDLLCLQFIFCASYMLIGPLTASAIASIANP
jgi:hypothetical protein